MTIPQQTLSRMPRYFRVLRELVLRGELRISSGKLADLLGLTSSQVRSDLSLLDGIGQQGYGYSVKVLYTEISRFLGVGDGFSAILIGDCDCPPLSEGMFSSRGVQLKAVFSDHPTGFAGRSGIRSVSELNDYCRSESPDIAVLLPLSCDVKTLAGKLISLGIRGIWNFTMTELNFPDIPVCNVMPGDMLMTVCAKLHNSEPQSFDKEN